MLRLNEWTIKHALFNHICCWVRIKQHNCGNNRLIYYIYIYIYYLMRFFLDIFLMLVIVHWVVALFPFWITFWWYLKAFKILWFWYSSYFIDSRSFSRCCSLGSSVGFVLYLRIFFQVLWFWLRVNSWSPPRSLYNRPNKFLFAGSPSWSFIWLFYYCCFKPINYTKYLYLQKV